MTAPTPLYARQIRVMNMALNGHEERRALPDGPPVLVKGRALIGPTQFPEQRWKPEIFQGESAHRTRGGKWLIDFDPRRLPA